MTMYLHLARVWPTHLSLCCLLLIALAGCNPSADPVVEDGVVRLIGRAEDVPFTTASVLALEDGRACVFGTFERRVVCGGQGWTDRVVIGREGRGPGEFDRTGALVRTTEGLGVLNAGRLSVFTTEGRLVRTANVGVPMRRPIEPVDSLLVGVTWDMPAIDRALLVSISTIDGGVRWQRALASQTLPHRPGMQVHAQARSAIAPTGETAVSFYDGRVEIFSADGSFVAFFDHPDPMGRHSQRDLEDYADGYRRLTGRDLPAAEFQERARRPRLQILPGGMRYGPAGTLWIASTRDRDRYSYIDVFRGTDRVAVVRVQDRLMSYDVRDTTLVVLVERSSLSAEGIRPYAIEWHAIDLENAAFHGDTTSQRSTADRAGPQSEAPPSPPWDMGVQVGRVLEEAQVPPRLADAAPAGGRR